MPEHWRPAGHWTPPADDVIDVWRFDLSLRDGDWDVLSPDEAQRARRIIVPDKSEQRAAARARLRHILARYLDADPAGLRFEYGEHGKPALSRDAAPSFNLSHSGSVGLIGVTDGVRIGVDVEYAAPGRAFSAIAKRFFSRAESADLDALSEPERPFAFYRAWTRKEAYLKAWGTGLTFPSDRFTIQYTHGPGRLVATHMPGDEPAGWRFANVEAGPEYAGAICFEGAERVIRWWEG